MSELIDVWTVSPYLSDEYDCAAFDDLAKAIAFMGELAGQWADIASVDEAIYIKLSRESMTRDDYEELRGDE